MREIDALHVGRTYPRRMVETRCEWCRCAECVCPTPATWPCACGEEFSIGPALVADYVIHVNRPAHRRWRAWCEA